MNSMKQLLICLMPLLLLTGCGSDEEPSPVIKEDDSTICVYWACSKEEVGKKYEERRYMQKYIRDSSGKYSFACTFKLREGIGAFPLKDLGKYTGNSFGKQSLNIRDIVLDPCPYCMAKGMFQCGDCKTIYCYNDVKYDNTGIGMVSCKNPDCSYCGKIAYIQGEITTITIDGG